MANIVPLSVDAGNNIYKKDKLSFHKLFVEIWTVY